jgi:hypothetical protein
MMRCLFIICCSCCCCCCCCRPHLALTTTTSPWTGCRWAPAHPPPTPPPPTPHPHPHPYPPPLPQANIYNELIYALIAIDNAHKLKQEADVQPPKADQK